MAPKPTTTPKSIKTSKSIKSPKSIKTWLTAVGRFLPTPDQLLVATIDQLFAHGVPLWRVRLSPRVLSPVSWATGLLWSRGADAVERYEVPHDIGGTPGFVGSPFDIIYRTGCPFHRRLDRIQPGDHRMLTDLRASGATDYLAIPMRFSDRQLHAISFATDQAGGFTDRQFRQLTAAAAGLAIALEPMMLRRETRELLNAYIGQVQATRVLDGCVRRGFYQTIETAMMFADMEGYTAMSNREPIATVVGLLDDFFGAVTDAVSAHRGQVLKFIGDGILSIFPAFADDAAGLGRPRAYAALRDAQARIAASGLPIRFRAILHHGTVAYGNIGGVDRLDFTVVGPAVNLASRLQPVSKQLGRPVLATRSFAQGMGQFVAVGSRPVADFPEPIELYAPRDP